MSERELAKQIIDKLPEYKMTSLLLFLRGIEFDDEIEDDLYCEKLVEVITDLRNFNVSSEIKTRLYRIPTYTSILEGCLANFFRVIVSLLGQALGKDYSVQNTLGQLINVL